MIHRLDRTFYSQSLSLLMIMVIIFNDNYGDIWKIGKCLQYNIKLKKTKFMYTGKYVNIVCA